MRTSIDYTHIFVNQQDIKTIFRRLKNQEQSFKKALSYSHNKFYQKIMHARRLQLQDDSALKELVRGKQSNDTLENWKIRRERLSYGYG